MLLIEASGNEHFAGKPNFDRLHLLKMHAIPSLAEKVRVQQVSFE